MFDTAIFDLDGTLLNTLDDLKDSTNFALRKYCYPERTLDEIRNFVGNGVNKLIERAIPDGLKNSDFDNCLKDFKNHYKSNMYNTTKPYGGIVGLLEELKKRNVKTAVVSNKFDAAVRELCENFFGSLIDISVGESDSVKKKPAPDSVLQAIHLLKANKEKTIYIGDSEVDIQTAKNAHITCIGVTWGFRSKELLLKEGADYLADSPDVILKIITGQS